MSKDKSGFPQTLIISFDKVVHLSQIQVLSHEFAIASRIELFILEIPITTLVPAVEDVEFKRLGHFSLSSNESNHWQSRELKSVFVDVRAGLLKFVLHSPHKNSLNSRGKVGLISIRCLGDEDGEEGIMEGSISASPALISGVDSISRELVVECESEWKEAINSLNPELAKTIQERIDFLMKSGASILDLETRKLHAVETENYDEAKKLKQEISDLRDSQKLKTDQNAVVSFVSSLWKTQDEPIRPTTAVLTGGVSSKRIVPPVPGPTQNSAVKPTNTLPTTQESPEKAVIVQIPDELPAYFERDYPQLLESLGKEIVTFLMSRDWRLRVDGISRVIDKLSSKKNSSANNRLIYGIGWIIQKLINDKIINIYISVCSLIDALSTTKHPNIISISEILEMALIHMIESRLIDSNKRVLEATIQTINSMTHFLHVNLICHYLCKPVQDKHLVHARCLVLAALVDAVGVNAGTYSAGILSMETLINTLGAWYDLTCRDSIYLVLIKLCDTVGVSAVTLAIESLQDASVRENLLHELNKYTRADPVHSLALGAEDSSQCEFCGRLDSKFTNAESLDLHYWNECPNLIECHFCQQIIELLSLSEHRMKECNSGPAFAPVVAMK